MANAVIVDGLRTPFTKAGTFPGLTAGSLALEPVMELLIRYPDLRNKIDCVIGANIGNQALPPDGSNLARLIALRAELPETIPAWTVNINCASGLHAVLDAVKQIELGQFKCVLVVAAEVMSDYTAVYPREQRLPILTKEFLKNNRKMPFWKKAIAKLMNRAKLATMPHDPQLMIKLGLTDPFCGLGMDKISDQLAADWKISRTELDLYAQESHARASEAQLAGRFDGEIAVPEGWDKKDFRDNGIRHDQLLEQLAKLKAMNPNGVTTAGNSSQISDGAVAMIVADLKFAMEQDWPVLAMMDSRKSAVAGCTPSKMGLGPVNAIAKLCQKNSLELNQFDLIETNEAFASVVLAQSKAMASPEYCAMLGLAKPLGPLPWDRTNVNGGAIALGHPISASGARLVLTCAKEMDRRKVDFGLVTLCVGGGQGEAAVIESPGF
ncbi:MAG: thiolase family protein [Patescibacteria group bacterium]